MASWWRWGRTQLVPRSNAHAAAPRSAIMRTARRPTATSRRAGPGWWRSPRAGGGSSAVEADDRGGNNQRPALLERQDCTLVAWYRSLYAPRTGGAYDSHHRTAGIAGRTRRGGGRAGARAWRAPGRESGGWG